MAAPEIAFITSLLVTVAFLVGAAITGHRKLIRRHVTFVAASVVSLGTAIYFALETGKLYDLEAAGWITPFHLGLAKFTTYMYLWPLITGPLVHRGRVAPRVHRIGAWAVLGLTLLATITGVMMLMGAERLV